MCYEEPREKDLEHRCYRSGTFYIDGGSYPFARTKLGCSHVSVPGLIEFCLDWNKGHFRFVGHKKRCLADVAANSEFYESPDAATSVRVFQETECTE